MAAALLNIENPEEIYYGSRGESFQDLIKGLLKRGKLKKEYIEKITDESAMKLYSQAFTDPSANPESNYEYFELLGDSILNTSIVWSLSRRFPQLDCPLGVKVMARLKINLVSKKTFANIAGDYGFFQFVTATNEVRGTKMKKLLEDTFEAFFGLTAKLLDERIKLGVGYPICYNIISGIVNDLPISLNYEDLYDAKTRLKELFDFLSKQGFGQVKYESERLELGHTVTVYRLYDGRRIKIGEGTAPLKADAEQKAATVALAQLKRQGFEKPVPPEYRMFAVMDNK